LLVKQTEKSPLPVVVLLHGGGLSDWSVEPVAEILKHDYQVVTPIIDGHGSDYFETFISIEESARKLIEYIDEQCNGKVFALCGLSLGAQIVLEVLSQRSAIAENAIIESALVFPMKAVELLAAPTYALFYGLIKQRWFSKMQAKELLIPESMFEKYYRDIMKMSKASLTNITKSNAAYSIKDSLANTNCSILILVGSLENSMMRKSAEAIHSTIEGSKLHILPDMKHGELSICNPRGYANLLSHSALAARGAEVTALNA